MRTALLIEDEFLIRELAEAYLSDAGFEVTSARDGNEAIEVLSAETKFDLLFTDIRMPGGIDGHEIAARAMDMIDGLRVIYATGYRDTANKLSSSEVCIEKPYNMATLRRALDELGFPAA